MTQWSPPMTGVERGRTALHAGSASDRMWSPERGGGPNDDWSLLWDSGGGWPLGLQAGPPGESTPTSAARCAGPRPDGIRVVVQLLSADEGGECASRLPSFAP